jgi:hypothetical protein
MPRRLAPLFLAPLLAACAGPAAAEDPFAEVPQEPYAAEVARPDLNLGQLLVQCDIQLNAWQMAMGAPRTLENLETIGFTERSIATLVHQNREELEQLTVSGPPRSRAIATAALAFSPDPAVLELILNNVADPDPMVAANALLAVGIHADPATPLAPVQAVVMNAAAPDAVVRNAAYACLRLARVQGETPDPYLAATMIPLLRHDLISVRSQAAAGLGVVRASHAVGFLAERLRDDGSARVRTNAAWALGEIGDRGAARPLARALRDSDGYVAGAARAALMKLFGEDRGPDPEDWLPQDQL